MAHADEFERIVAANVARFFTQTLHAAPAAADTARFAAQLLEVVAERGLPRALRDDEQGEPGGLPESECAALATRVAAGLVDPLFAEAAKQLVKACFYPEFKVCRDSFREVGRDGACRRQELERARGRISGAHCVDCPHWVALTPEDHRAYLTQEWRGDPAVLAEHCEVFLPESFRALRVWLHTAARQRPPLR